MWILGKNADDLKCMVWVFRYGNLGILMLMISIEQASMTTGWQNTVVQLDNFREHSILTGDSGKFNRYTIAGRDQLWGHVNRDQVSS